MPNYNQGKIYKLISTETDNVYVGSTSLNYLSSRLVCHRADYARWLARKYSYVSSFEIVKYEDCKIILLENFPCDSKDQLTAREQYWIDTTPECVNNRKANTGLSIDEYQKQYNQLPKFKAMKKQYYQQPKIKAMTKKYNQMQIKCVCGSICIRNAYSRHTKSQTHEDFVNQHDDLSELFQLEMQARFKTALVLSKLKAINL